MIGSCCARSQFSVSTEFLLLAFVFVIFTTGTLQVCSVKFNFSGLDTELSVEAATALFVFADARKHDTGTAGSLALSNSMCYFPFAWLLRADSPITRKSIFFLHKQQKQEYLVSFSSRIHFAYSGFVNHCWLNAQLPPGMMILCYSLMRRVAYPCLKAR